MAITDIPAGRLVDIERGQIDRRIFNDPEIFEEEMRLIFKRAWLFLGHVSQIPQPGDFFEAPMGRDNVLLVRQKDGSLKGLLNTCRHRGNAVCRAEEGNTRKFMCTYHGWTYDLSGRLLGVPGLKQLYGDDFDRSAHGLAEVAQLDSYEGFVFATMDPDAPPLYDYLGETGRLGINLIALRGDMEVVPGIQKFVIPCNWKFAVDNLFDWYHVQITHLSAFQAGLLPSVPNPDAAHMGTDGVARADGAKIRFPGGTVGGDAPESIVCLDHYGHAIAGPSREASRLEPGGDAPWRDTPRARAALGPVGVDVAGHPNIFPTMWISPAAAGITQVSLRIPRSPTETELWWYTFVDRNAPPEERTGQVQAAIHAFGPAGALEQEDGENWAQSTLQTHGAVSRDIPQLLTMDLGKGRVIRDDQGPPRIYGTTNEHGQLWTYDAWQAWLSSPDWDTLRLATTPPEVL